MAFNIQKALEAGATEDQILEYLGAQRTGFNIAGALEQGASKADVIKYLAANTERPQQQPQQQPEPPTDAESLVSSAGNMASNVMGDMGEIWGSISQMAQHPIDTANNLGDLAIGAVETMIPGGNDPREKMASDVFNHYGKMIAGAGTTALDALLPKSLESKVPDYWREAEQYFNKESGENPLKTMLDFSPLLGTMSKGSKLAALSDPLSGTAALAKGTRKLIPEAAEKRIMASAVQPSGNLNRVDRVVQTMLDKKLGTTEKRTLRPLEKRLGEIYDEVDSNILKESKAGETVDITEIINKAYNEEIASRKFDVNSIDELEKLNKQREKVLKEFGGVIPLEDALKLRRDTDKGLNRLWRSRESGSTVDSSGILAANKRFADELRAKVNSYSNNASLNKEASELLRVIPDIEKVIVNRRKGKLVPVGPGELVAGTRAFGGDVTQAGSIIGLLKAADSPPVKAWMARLLRKGRTAEPAKVGRYQALTQAALKDQQARDRRGY